MATDVLAIICAVVVVGGVAAFVVDRWWLVWDWWPLVGWEWRAERADRRQLERTRREIEAARVPVDSIPAGHRGFAGLDGPLTATVDLAAVPDYDEDDPDDESWADELHAINQELHGNVIQGQFGDLSRPMEQLTHYEVEAVIVRLGRADWLPAAA